MFFHERERCFDSHECSSQIAVKHFIPLFKGYFFNSSVFWTGIGCIVYQNVDSTIFFCCIFHQLFDRLRIHQIHVMIDGSATSLSDFLGYCFTFFSSAAANGHDRSFSSIQLGNCDSDSAGRACDYSYFIF